ncbi:MAG: hypothetical protein JWN32_714 [Solirubrobacterales bacterium]|nr:hypothetical protein [Solirubrobacterales bacterium]
MNSYRAVAWSFFPDFDRAVTVTGHFFPALGLWLGAWKCATKGAADADAAAMSSVPATASGTSKRVRMQQQYDSGPPINLTVVSRAVRRLLPIPALLALALGLAPPAAAQVTAQLNPNTAGAGAHLILDAKGTDAGLRPQTIPSGLAIGFDRGFTFDPNAVAGVCSDEAAAKFTCPANSIVATGSIDLLGEGFAFGAHGTAFTAQLTFYRATPRQPGDPMGVVFYFREPTSNFQGASIGRLRPASDPVLGEELRFDKLPIPALPNGLHFTLREVKLDFGAGASTPPVRVARKKRGTRRTRVRGDSFTRTSARFVPGAGFATAPTFPASAALLNNPATCAGTWRVRFEVDYGDGPQTHDAVAPCARS